jgi:hypothetical protein
MNEYFSVRQSCPCCKSTSNTTLCQIGYTESPIKEYLDSFYSPIGIGVEFEYLEGGYYILNECRDCGLIYQEEVSDDFLMHKLYEQWLDPMVILERHNNGRDARHFLWVAREIANVIQYFDAVSGQLKFFDFGMGWGKWCFVAKGFGCDVYGTELSQVRIDYANASGIKVISWEEIPDHQFDFRPFGNSCLPQACLETQWNYQD